MRTKVSTAEQAQPTPTALLLEPITPESPAGIGELSLDVAGMPRPDPDVPTAWWVRNGYALVGVAAEYREWAGGRPGPATYDVAHTPPAGPSRPCGGARASRAPPPSPPTCRRPAVAG